MGFVFGLSQRGLTSAEGLREPFFLSVASSWKLGSQERAPRPGCAFILWAKTVGTWLLRARCSDDVGSLRGGMSDEQSTQHTARVHAASGFGSRHCIHSLESF